MAFVWARSESDSYPDSDKLDLDPEFEGYFPRTQIWIAGSNEEEIPNIEAIFKFLQARLEQAKPLEW